MRKKLDERLLRTGGPECDSSILVPDVKNSIVWVLCHRHGRSKLRGHLRNKLSGRCVLVFENTTCSLFVANIVSLTNLQQHFLIGLTIDMCLAA